MDNPSHKIMQEKSSNDIVCSKCGFKILTVDQASAYRERDIEEVVKKHKCTIAAESKRDFEDEIR